MRFIICLASITLLSACAGSPPKPPLPKGEYRPINRLTSVQKGPAAAESFDLYFEGDISDAVRALARAAGNAIALAPVGISRPVPVRVDLTNTNTQRALQAIGMQGGNQAEIVWNSTRNLGINEFYVRYLPTNAPAIPSSVPNDSPARPVIVD